MAYQYPKTIRTLHWLTLGLLILQVALGFLMEDFKPLFYAHIATGACIVLITGLRLFYRLKKTPPPQKPEKLSTKEWKIAKLGHFIMYIFLFIVPLSGIAALYNEEMFAEYHEILVFAFIALIAGHAAIVIKHYLHDKENLISRIQL